MKPKIPLFLLEAAGTSFEMIDGTPITNMRIYIYLFSKSFQKLSEQFRLALLYFRTRKHYCVKMYKTKGNKEVLFTE